MANVLVFGHQNPDNDAIMSTVVLSQLLNQLEYQGNTYTACCLGPLPAESAKLLEDAGVPAPTLIDAIEPAAEGTDPQLVILCDHNEPGQSVAGLENATIFGVVDHHRFGDFTTAAPLHIVALPWGSSCSIVAKLFEVMGVEPTDTQAKLLLSAMMTDTLMLKSPTATAVDAAIAE
ncbi:inorganic diphosphatase PpaC, partial [gut metagenome]